VLIHRAFMWRISDLATMLVAPVVEACKGERPPSPSSALVRRRSIQRRLLGSPHLRPAREPTRTIIIMRKRIETRRAAGVMWAISAGATTMNEQSSLTPTQRALQFRRLAES